ncbi:hypothetical protein DL89DRAFT_71744 [Linderina pennispora]|uniref:Uncharacterized protein n=1 Tax=Linderina pennispora TaxID=61395 RepID=A0A1Y1VQX8_9FUNG|nr:uncharacterized protein DL89DRAFT_71744 [Linderina pennispora]ORX63688.1 hypothetical protein DL89DRAFT_71744 [Linderina pennispora]
MYIQHTLLLCVHATYKIMLADIRSLESPCSTMGKAETYTYKGPGRQPAFLFPLSHIFERLFLHIPDIHLSFRLTIPNTEACAATAIGARGSRQGIHSRYHRYVHIYLQTMAWFLIYSL